MGGLAAHRRPRGGQGLAPPGSSTPPAPPARGPRAGTRP
jgi:hypothetical protein